jgi:2-methylcitrate dehydratase PrpD
VGARVGLALPGESPQRILNAGQALAAASAVSHLIGLPGGLRLSAVEAVIGWLSAGLPPGLPHQGNRVQAAHVAWGSTLAVLSAAGGLQVRQEALAPKAYPAQPEENSYRIVDAALKRHAGARHVQGCVEIGRVMRDRVRGKTESISSILIAGDGVMSGARDAAAPDAAQASRAFALVAGLRFGALEPAIYRAARFQDAELRRLERLVVCAAAPESAGDKVGLSVELMAGGERHHVQTAPLDTEPATISDEEVAAKFLRYTAGIIDAERAYNFASVVLRGDGDIAFRAAWDLLF